MEKIIFFGLVIPIMAYVLYLGGMAIMNGFKSKEVNIVEKEEAQTESREARETSTEQSSNLSDELNKLNDLKEKGIISQEEFEKAKNKLLNN
jgi:ribosomal protein L14E/L6E/L27E